MLANIKFTMNTVKCLILFIYHYLRKMLKYYNRLLSI